MPKNKFQEVIFTIIMVFVMVYAMICYNIVLNTGTMTNETFLLAFHELTFMGPIAFILDFFIIGGLAKKIVVTHTISANGCVIAPVTRFTLSLLISPDGSIIPLSKSTFFMSSSYNLWCQNGARSYKIILYGDTAR